MHIVLADVPVALSLPLKRALGARHRISTLTEVTDRARCQAMASCDVVIHGTDAQDAMSAIDRATRGTWNLLTTTKARRYVYLSSMTVFDGYPTGWRIDEAWLPRPTPHPTSFAAHLAEVTARELSRVRLTECVSARLDRLVPADIFDTRPIRPDWLHVEDAVRAIARIAECDRLPNSTARWQPVHVVRGDPASRFPPGVLAGPALAFTPERAAVTYPSPPSGTPTYPADPEPLTELTSPQTVTVFGAGGPLGAATTRELETRHRLLLTDARPLAECAEAAPQTPGAPLPTPPTAPHRERVVDITDPAAVRAAASGADCLINCAVVRTDVDPAFAVNVLGAYNVMRAAIDAGIPRVVHTGPALVFEPHPIGYDDDHDIGPLTPPRPGGNLYFLTKYLGQEITRLLAEHHGIACPILLFCGFVNPAETSERPPHPFSVSWGDAARAMAAATTIPRLPEPCPMLHIHADAPHGRYRNTAARTVLRWDPHDSLEPY